MAYDLLKDPQRFKVYAIERQVFRDGYEDISWKDAAKLTYEWAKDVGIDIRFINMLSDKGKYGGLADRKRHCISYPKSGAPAWIIVHELSHFLGKDHHGPDFCAWYIVLTNKFLGTNDAYTLHGAFKAVGVVTNLEIVNGI